MLQKNVQTCLPETNTHDTIKNPTGFTMFHVMSNLQCESEACFYFISPPRLKVSGGWAGVPIETFRVCTSLLSRFPTLCKHGDTKQQCETYVKPM